LLDAWKASRADLEFLSYQPLLVVCGDNDTAAVIVQMRVKKRSSGNLITLMVADFLRFRANRVLEYRQFMDTFDAIQQTVGLEITIPKK
jgi:ketosteroid isomerase-like protein